jgi:uncharacterized heparinase superfamily protein
MTSIRLALETLFDQRAAALPAVAFADVLDRLLWCVADNGSSILELQRQWLSGDDRARVEVALAMAEAAPMTMSEVDETATKIAARWPDLQPQCEAFRRRWREVLRDL